MTTPVQILDARGEPFKPNKASMLASGGTAPYDAADYASPEMAAWTPWLWSPDTELNIYRDRIVSRVRDLVRNDGWASGAVTRILDNAVGAVFHPNVKPDYQLLSAYTGNKAFDYKWADEFGRTVEAYWRLWANDPNRYCDSQRNLTVTQMMRLAFRHLLIDGDALAVMRWIPSRIGDGRAKFATTVQMVDPDRLSNPMQQFDVQSMRGGVEIDEYGAAIAYHIREAHQGDWYDAAKSFTWERVDRETSWGRPIVVHYFEHERSGQHRGGAGIFTPVLSRLKMLAKYDSVELESAVLNAVFSAYVESPFDPSFVEQALGDGEELNAYQTARSEFHGNKRMTLGGARLPILFPGEKITSVTAQRPNSNFPDFEKAVLRNFASASGLSAQQVSQDWSDVNYSSARAALLESWKTITRRRLDFGIGFGQPIFCAFLEELFDLGLVPLPDNAPSFNEMKAAYSRCRWMGPGRGWVDPVKEKEGSILGMQAGLSTLEQECAENAGEDWEEVLDQRQREIEAFKARGIPVPEWVNSEQKLLKPNDGGAAMTRTVQTTGQNK